MYFGRRSVSSCKSIVSLMTRICNFCFILNSAKMTMAFATHCWSNNKMLFISFCVTISKRWWHLLYCQVLSFITERHSADSQILTAPGAPFTIFFRQKEGWLGIFKLWNRCLFAICPRLVIFYEFSAIRTLFVIKKCQSMDNGVYLKKQ